MKNPKNRTPSRTPVPMKATKPKPGDLFADQQDRQRTFQLGDPVTDKQRNIIDRGLKQLKAWRLGEKGKK